MSRILLSVVNQSYLGKTSAPFLSNSRTPIFKLDCSSWKTSPSSHVSNQLKIEPGMGQISGRKHCRSPDKTPHCFHCLQPYHKAHECWHLLTCRHCKGSCHSITNFQMAAVERKNVQHIRKLQNRTKEQQGSNYARKLSPTCFMPLTIH